MQKITPFLWYSKEAEEAAAFYASVFPDSRVSRVTALPSESPSGPALMATKGWPKRTNSTIFTDPGGPLGDSLGNDVTRLTRELGKMEA